MAEPKRGTLKIFMGYAAGVGKTYRMLEEAHACKAAGVDVVVGYFQPHACADTVEKTKGLEIIPWKTIHYHGAIFEEFEQPYRASRSVEASRALAPSLMDFDQWLEKNKSKIPLG